MENRPKISKEGNLPRKQKRKGRKKTYENNPKIINKMAIRKYILVIILNVNGLKAPTKRHRLAEWIQKQDPYIYCLQQTHFRPRDTYRLKDIPRKWKLKQSWSSNIHIRQNRL